VYAEAAVVTQWTPGYVLRRKKPKNGEGYLIRDFVVGIVYLVSL
jgi:hypothetical protein